MIGFWFVFFVKQKTAYEMRISDWSSDVCSSDLLRRLAAQSSARARLFDTDGEMVADSRLLLAAGRGVITRQLPPPQIDTPWERALIDIYDHINAQIGRASRRERVCPYV